MTVPLFGVTELPALTESDFRRISQLAYDLFGLHLSAGKEGLVRARLGKKIRQGGFRSFAEYHRHVLADRTGEALIELIDSLTTNYTCFYRERAHFDFLTQELTGELRDLESLRIWSAACSSGEEPYTIAMTLMDIAASIRCGWAANYRIVATDISTRMLNKARQAVYEEDRFQGMPQGWWKSYLLKGHGESAGRYKLKPAVKQAVEFDRLNLIEPLPRRTFQFIFCRNVMIYFDKPTQQDIVSRLTECIEPGGYLFVGHSETLNGFDHSLRYVHPAVYRKNGPGRPRRRA
ncbi:MAG TPA: protein-glutamate O-methyltransferase CheR [Bryobacteraceae bacterium]|nr:protein-glutamate O-methyltransferase CheR [Bryobacteraceae bacterium]